MFCGAMFCGWPPFAHHGVPKIVKTTRTPRAEAVITAAS